MGQEIFIEGLTEEELQRIRSITQEVPPKTFEHDVYLEAGEVKVDKCRVDVIFTPGHIQIGCTRASIILLKEMLHHHTETFKEKTRVIFQDRYL